MSTELYKKYRPQELADFSGNAKILKLVRTWLDKHTVPSAVLLIGPSGCGKTSLARVLTTNLDCAAKDFVEYNTADFGGVDVARYIRRRCSIKPFHKSLVFLLDEFHQTSSDFQDCILKLLEDGPPDVYFFLATTDPNKVRVTIKTRCALLEMELLNRDDMLVLLRSVLQREGRSLTEDVLDKIVKNGEGSPRQALNLLEKALTSKKEEEQLALVDQPAAQEEGLKIGIALLNPGKADWGKLAKVLKNVKQEPEVIRQIVLTMAMNALLKGGKNAAKANWIITCFSEPFFTSKKAGLVSACYQALYGCGG